MNLSSLKSAIASVLSTSLAPIIAPVLNSALTNNVLNAVGRSVVSTAEFTRPADVIAYAQLDVVSSSTAGGSAAMLQFDNMSRVNGGSGYITKAIMKTEFSNFTASLRLHLYSKSTEIVSPTGDNLTFVDSYADRGAYVGYIDFDVAGPEAAGAGAAAKSQNTLCRLAYQTAVDSTKLYGILQLRSPLSGTTIAPLSGQKFSISLTGEQN